MEGAALGALERFRQSLEADQKSGEPMEISPVDAVGLLCYIFDRSPDEMARLTNELSRIDKEISEIYHEIECTNFNAAGGYYFAKRLQMKLRERRQIKIDYKIMQMLGPIIKANRDRVLDIGEKIFREIAERDKWYQEGI